MQKIYIGKQTNSVCQIIEDYFENFEGYNELTFGSKYYMIVLEDGKKLDSHDYFYNPDTEEFEKIEGIVPSDHIASEIEPSKTELLEKENQELKERLDRMEMLLNTLVLKTE